MKHSYSPTSLQILLRCSRQWVLSELHYLQPVEHSPYMAAGTIMHAALERMYKGEPWIEWFDADVRTALALDENAILEKRTRLARTLLMEYPHFYKGEILQPLAVECPVKVPAPGHPDSFITGKIDMIALNRLDGGLVIVDHKSASDFSSYNNMGIARDLQFSTYLWLASQLWPQHTNVKLAVNVLRIKEVSDPRVIAGGMLSRDKQVATTPHRFRTKLAEMRLDEEPYAHYLQTLRQESQFFKRFWLRQNEIHDIEHELERSVWYAKQVEEGRMGPVGVPHAMSTCQWDCDFNTVCFLMEATGKFNLSEYTNLLTASTWHNSKPKNYVTPENAAERLEGWIANPLPGLQ